MKVALASHVRRKTGETFQQVFRDGRKRAPGIEEGKRGQKGVVKRGSEISRSTLCVRSEIEVQGDTQVLRIPFDVVLGEFQTIRVGIKEVRDSRMTEKTLGTMGRIHMGEKRKLIVDISFFFPLWHRP